MIRVGHFIDYFGYAIGGAERNVEGLCSHHPPGFIPEIVTSVSPFIRPKFPAGTAPIRTTLGLHPLREWSFLFRGRLSDLLYRAPGALYRRTVRRHFPRYGILHCHGFDVAAEAVLRCPERPMVITLYNPVDRRHLDVLRGAAAVIVRSEEVAERLAKMAPDLVHKASYIPPGCLFSQYEASDDVAQRGRRVLVVGRLRPFKNHETLFRAAALLNRRGRPIELTVIGAGPRRRPLESLARELGLRDALTFTPFRAPSEMKSEYQAHDLVVVPSVYESFSQVALEALVAGRRLLVSTGLHEFMRLFPEVPSVEATDAEAIADGIDGALGRPPLRLEPDRFAPFDWTSVARQHGDLYASLLERHS
jgi:glycosyltransferase involved in cell wall biosynthesis